MDVNQKPRLRSKVSMADTQRVISISFRVPPIVGVLSGSFIEGDPFSQDTTVVVRGSIPRLKEENGSTFDSQK